MQYFSELPEISYSGIAKDNLVELEIDGEVEEVPEEHSKEDAFFLGRMGGTIYLVFGLVAEREYIKPEDSQSGKGFTRLKIEGTCVTVF